MAVRRNPTTVSIRGISNRKILSAIKELQDQLGRKPTSEEFTQATRFSHGSVTQRFKKKWSEIVEMVGRTENRESTVRTTTVTLKPSGPSSSNLGILDLYEKLMDSGDTLDNLLEGLQNLDGDIHISIVREVATRAKARKATLKQPRPLSQETTGASDVKTSALTSVTQTPDNGHLKRGLMLS